MLLAERTALNLIQRMSGSATLTARYVAAAGGRARILDTRKTTPGLRALEKYAVTCGGGENHRFGLYDEVMVKDNHTDLAGRPLVDNMAPDVLSALCPRLRAAAEQRGRQVQIEASGGIGEDDVPAVAASGVDRISIGALTHSAAALDLSLYLEPAG